MNRQIYILFLSCIYSCITQDRLHCQTVECVVLHKQGHLTPYKLFAENIDDTIACVPDEGFDRFISKKVAIEPYVDSLDPYTADKHPMNIATNDISYPTEEQICILVRTNHQLYQTRSPLGIKKAFDYLLMHKLINHSNLALIRLEPFEMPMELNKQNDHSLSICMIQNANTFQESCIPSLYSYINDSLTSLSIHRIIIIVPDILELPPQWIRYGWIHSDRPLTTAELDRVLKYRTLPILSKQYHHDILFSDQGYAFLLNIYPIITPHLGAPASKAIAKMLEEIIDKQRVYIIEPRHILTYIYDTPSTRHLHTTAQRTLENISSKHHVSQNIIASINVLLVFPSHKNATSGTLANLNLKLDSYKHIPGSWQIETIHDFYLAINTAVFDKKAIHSLITAAKYVTKKYNCQKSPLKGQVVYIEVEGPTIHPQKTRIQGSSLGLSAYALFESLYTPMDTDSVCFSGGINEHGYAEKIGKSLHKYIASLNAPHISTIVLPKQNKGHLLNLIPMSFVHQPPKLLFVNHVDEIYNTIKQ